MSSEQINCLLLNVQWPMINLRGFPWKFLKCRPRWKTNVGCPHCLGEITALYTIEELQTEMGVTSLSWLLQALSPSKSWGFTNPRSSLSLCWWNRPTHVWLRQLASHILSLSRLTSLLDPVTHWGLGGSSSTKWNDTSDRVSTFEGERKLIPRIEAYFSTVLTLPCSWAYFNHIVPPSQTAS